MGRSIPSTSLRTGLRPYKVILGSFCTLHRLSKDTVSRAEPARDVLGVIGQDQVRASTLNTGENLENDAPLVEPTVSRGGFHHGVFAADVVSADGNIEAIADLADD